MKKLLLISLICLSAHSYAQVATSTDSGRSFNIRFAPVGLVFGILNAQLDYKLNDSFTVGASFATLNWTIFDTKVSGSSFGVSGQFYFDGVYKDSWYLQGSAESVNYSVEDTKKSLKATASAMVPQFGGGYHWFWQSFNLNLGLTVGLVPVDVTYSDGTKSTVPASAGGIDFRLGFVF